MTYVLIAILIGLQGGTRISSLPSEDALIPVKLAVIAADAWIT